MSETSQSISASGTSDFEIGTPIRSDGSPESLENEIGGLIRLFQAAVQKLPDDDKQDDHYANLQSQIEQRLNTLIDRSGSAGLTSNITFHRRGNKVKVDVRLES